MKVVKLRTKSDAIQLTCKEALQAALDSDFDTQEVIILLYSDENYEFWQGGSLSVADIAWHLDQYKTALLDGRLEE